MVWLTADVHYAAAHHYDPARAPFNDFEPFWEFVAGPLNAGAFGPNALDHTFGRESCSRKSPPAGRPISRRRTAPATSAMSGSTARAAP